MLRKKYVLPFLSILAAILACGPFGALTSATPVEPESVGTIVAATLTALAPPVEEDTAVPPLSSPASPTAEPTSTAPAPLRIVYTSVGEAWVLEGSAPSRQITHTGGVQTVVISDDGLRVVYLRRDSNEAPAELRAVGSDGTGDISLLTPDQANSLHPLEDWLLRIEPSSFDFVPGTHDLFFNTRAVAEGPGLLKFNDLYQLNADTGHLALVLPAEQGGDFNVSPNGSQIAIVQPDSISMANIDGSGLRENLVTFDPVLTYSEYQYYPRVVWAADSSAAEVVIPSREPLGSDPTASVWRIPAHTGSAVRLSTIPGDFFFFGMGAHSLISPDLSRVAFARETTTPNVTQLIIADVDGSDEVVHGTGRFFWQGWGPDASHFLYGSDLPSLLQLGQVSGGYTVVDEGTDVRWLGETEYLFLTGESGSWELHLGSIGGTSTSLATSSGQPFSYDFAD
jgi:hypothetical protein